MSLLFERIAGKFSANALHSISSGSQNTSNTSFTSSDSQNTSAKEAFVSKFPAELKVLLSAMRLNLEEATRSTEKGILQLAEAMEKITLRVRQGLTSLGELFERQQQKGKDRKREYDRIFQRLEGELCALNSRLNDLEELSKRVFQLEEVARREKYFTVLKELENISSQTRIVALNATIEAARLGAKGRGICVVAEEMGKLAVQAKEAVKNLHLFGEYLLDGLRNNLTLLEEQFAQARSMAKELEKSRQNAQELLEVLKKGEEEAAEDAASIAAELKTVEGYLDQGITAFQFQDAVAQQIAHVCGGLKLLEERLFEGKELEITDLLKELEEMSSMEKERAIYRQAAQGKGCLSGDLVEEDSPSNKIEFF